jgi:N-formylmaleamate deformylase
MSGQPPVRGVSRFAECGAVRLHALEYGEGGHPLLVLPGITSPAATWEFVAEPLALDGRVLTWDARGRGRSDHPATGYAVADFAADLALFLEATDLHRPAILGHSMGARVLVYFAARHPDKVGPLIIVDPPMMGPGRPPYAAPVSAYLDEMRAARAGELTLEDLRRSWPSWDAPRLRERQQWLPTCSEDGVRESYRGLERDDLVASWRALRGPVLLVRGAESPALSLADERELRVANPQLTYVSIAGAGHMVPYDRLDNFLAVVRNFLANSYEEGVNSA